MINSIFNNMIKKLTLVSFTLFIAYLSLDAQQKANSYLYDKLGGIYNPSYIPEVYYKYNHHTIAGLSARSQWGGIIKGPLTQTARLEFITKSDNTFNMLFGTNIVNDKIGPITSTGIYFKLANFMSNYNEDYGGFSAGIQFGAIQYRINTTSLYDKYPNDILTHNDTKLVNPELSVGFSYFNVIPSGVLNNTAIYAGVSLAQLGFNHLDFKDDSTDFSIYKKMHTYGYLKLRKPISSDIDLEMSSWVTYVQSIPTNIDFLIKLSFSDTFTIEGGTNSSGIAHFGFGMNLPKLLPGDKIISINYSFNPTLKNFSSLLGNTHEISVVYSGNSGN